MGNPSVNQNLRRSKQIKNLTGINKEAGDELRLQLSRKVDRWQADQPVPPDADFRFLTGHG